MPRDEVAGERDGRSVDGRREADRPLGVTRGRHHLDRPAGPLDALEVHQVTRDLDGGRAGEAQTRHVIAVVRSPELPERLGRFEQGALPGRHPDRDAEGGGAIIATALVAVVMRVGDRHDLPNAGLVEHVQDPARTQVDQEAALAGGPQEHVAGVAIPPQRWGQPGEAVGPPTCRAARRVVARHATRPDREEPRRVAHEHRVEGVLRRRRAHAGAARRVPGGGRSPSCPIGGGGTGRRCPGRGRSGPRSHPGPARATTVATSRSDGGHRPGPSSEWSKPKRSNPSVAPRSARARRSSGRSMAVLQCPRITRVGSAPAAVRASRTAPPSCPHGWRWTEIARPLAAAAAATPCRNRVSAGWTGSDVPISPKMPGRIPVSPMPASTVRRRRVVISSTLDVATHGSWTGPRYWPVPITTCNPERSAISRTRRASWPRDGGVSSTIVPPPARANGASSSTATSTSVRR